MSHCNETSRSTVSATTAAAASVSRSPHVKRHHSKSPILSRCLRRTSSTSLSLVSISSPPLAMQSTSADDSTRTLVEQQQKQEKCANLNDNEENTKLFAGSGATSTQTGGAGGGEENVSTGADSLFTRQKSYERGAPPASPSSLRVKVAAVRKMCNLWSHIKNSSPVKRAKMSTWMNSGTSTATTTANGMNSSGSGHRSSHHSLFSLKGMRGRKEKLKNSSHYSYSHPDISSGNLANLAFPSSSSRDDMAIHLISNTYNNEATVDTTSSVNMTAATAAAAAAVAVKTSNENSQVQPSLPKSVKNQILSALSRQSSKDVVSMLKFL